MTFQAVFSCPWTFPFTLQLSCWCSVVRYNTFFFQFTIIYSIIAARYIVNSRMAVKPMFDLFWQSKVFRILFDVIILNLWNSLLNFGPKFGIYGNVTTRKFSSNSLSSFFNAFCSVMPHASLMIYDWFVNIICLLFSKLIIVFIILEFY